MMTPAGMVIFLAQYGGIFFWALVIVVLVIGGFVAVTWLRRWVAEADESPAGGFSLGELRRLHQEGQMSDDEYEKAKAMVVDAAKTMAAKRHADQQQQQQQKRPPGLTR